MTGRLAVSYRWTLPLPVTIWSSLVSVYLYSSSLKWRSNGGIKAFKRCLHVCSCRDRSVQTLPLISEHCLIGRICTLTFAILRCSRICCVGGGRPLVTSNGLLLFFLSLLTPLPCSSLILIDRIIYGHSQNMALGWHLLIDYHHLNLLVKEERKDRLFTIWKSKFKACAFCESVALVLWLTPPKWAHNLPNISICCCCYLITIHFNLTYSPWRRKFFGCFPFL